MSDDYIKRKDAVSVCAILADKMDDVGFTAVSQCIGAIKDIYAADVVEVVRCKDCSRWCICHKSDDFFCSDGERRKG